MVNLLRRYQKPLVFVVVVVVVTWVFYTSFDPRGGMPRGDKVASLYGEGLTHLQWEKAGLRFRVAQSLRLSELVLPLAGVEAYYAAMLGQAVGDQTIDNYVWNSFVLRHEADALGVTATDAEIEEAIKKVPAFQTSNTFDYSKFAMFSQMDLSPRGLSQRDFEEVIGDLVRVRKVRALLGSTLHPTAAEVRAEYVDRHQKSEVSYVRLKLEDFKAAVQVTPEEVAKLFTERQASLKTPEKRKVKFVAFTLPGETKSLTGKDRAMATQKLAERAQNFALTMTEGKEASLEALAAKEGLTVAETPAFGEDDPPTELGRSPNAATAAFRLTKEEPNSDVVNGENGYYVLQLSATEPSRPLTLEEASAQLTEQIKTERAQEGLNLKAAELRTKLDEALKAGQSLSDAAKTAGVQWELLPPFSRNDQDNREAPEARVIKDRVATMKEGDLSELLPTDTGGVLAHLDKRIPIDEATYEKEKQEMTQRLGRAVDESLFQDWLRTRRAAANPLELRRRG